MRRWWKMSEKEWPKCQTTAPEHIVAHSHSTPETKFCNVSNAWDLPARMDQLELPGAHYTRTDIAEARIAELQARIAQLEESALTGYEDGWHALRNERDALRAGIEGAPVVHDVTGRLGFGGRGVALVLLGGDE